MTLERYSVPKKSGTRNHIVILTIRMDLCIQIYQIGSAVAKVTDQKTYREMLSLTGQVTTMDQFVTVELPFYSNKI